MKSKVFATSAAKPSFRTLVSDMRRSIIILVLATIVTFANARDVSSLQHGFDVASLETYLKASSVSASSATI